MEYSSFNFRGFALLNCSTLVPWEAKFVTKLYSKKISRTNWIIIQLSLILFCYFPYHKKDPQTIQTEFYLLFYLTTVFRKILITVDILRPILLKVLSALRFTSSSIRKLICAIISLFSFCITIFSVVNNIPVYNFEAASILAFYHCPNIYRSMNDISQSFLKTSHFYP